MLWILLWNNSGITCTVLHLVSHRVGRLETTLNL